MTILRPHQAAAIEAVYDYWNDGGGNPLVDMATGTGKSVVISQLTQRLLTEYPDMRILNLVHVRELVEQNAKALFTAWPSAPAGIYCSALKRQDAHHPITFGSIQSVYKKARVLGTRNAVFIDEAQLVPNEGGSMYRDLLTKLQDFDPDMRIVGFSATCYRLGSGRLDKGEGKLFDDVVFSYGIGKGIDDGWLSPLISKRGATQIDVSNVARRGGEFVSGALEAATDVDKITRSAVRDMAIMGQDRKSWLIFCAGKKHAGHVRDALRDAGISAEMITDETEAGERKRFIEQFRRGQIRALTNANVLTTGFDAPGVDMVVMLRSTLSTGLYVQIVGRGTRPVWPAGFNPDAATAEERKAAIAAGPKQDCLILDFAGNCRRHGPVDAIEIKPKKAKQDPDDKDDIEVKVTEATVRGKECPACNAIVGVLAARCQHCDHEFPIEVKHEPVADSNTPILASERAKIVSEIPVMSWSATKHEKPGKPASMRVTYLAGVVAQNEWVFFEGRGRQWDDAAKWWFQHGGKQPFPSTVDDAIARFRAREVRRPATIKTRPSPANPKYNDIVGRTFPKVTP